MNQTELIEQLCGMLECAVQIIRKQTAILAQQGMLDDDAESFIENTEKYIG